MISLMGWTSPGSRELFDFFVKQQAKERQEQLAQVTAGLQTLPVSPKILEQLCTLSPEDAQRALRQHPGYKEQRNLESIETMLQVFKCALVDLDTAIGSLPPLGPPAQRTERELLAAEVQNRVNKEILAVVSASHALVEYSRRVRSLVPEDLFPQKLSEVFDDDKHELVKQLRVVLSHLRHTIADWQITYSREGRFTRFKIQTEVLFAEAELNAAARRCLATYGEVLDISDLLSRYSKQVSDFYGWLLPELERRLPEPVKEFRRCKQAIKLSHARQSYKVLLGLWQQANVDPYEHLPKYLGDDQLSKALDLPRRSEAQVDYITSCVDRHSVCDRELRRMIHSLFKVANKAETRNLN